MAWHNYCVEKKILVYFLFRMDYVGVILLITTSYIPWLQFAFYCDNIIKLFYMTLVGVLAAGCISVVVQDKFREPCYRWLRLGMLIAAFVAKSNHHHHLFWKRPILSHYARVRRLSIWSPSTHPWMPPIQDGNQTPPCHHSHTLSKSSYSSPYI